uniref:Uncharacterized protein n=1 Tax=Arundo donax TaxID=35708 RepID=A0A0A9CKE8_ARUDO
MNIHFGGKQFARLLYARGPLIGSLWAADSDYDITVGDQVYRGRQERFRVPGTGDYHAVVCCCYHFDSRSMELHVRIMDNHTADGPLRWILFEAFDGFWLP